MQRLAGQVAVVARYGLPLMLPAKRGLVIFTTFTMGRKYLGNVFYCRTGQSLAVGNLAREYGFTDVDGRQPTAYPIVR